MNRRILFQVTTPAVVIGLLLLAACLVSVWYINRLQANLARILSQNVRSLEAAQDLEIQVRQLRFHCLAYLIEPMPARLSPIPVRLATGWTESAARRQQQVARDVFGGRGLTAEFDLAAGTDRSSAVNVVARWRRCNLVLLKRRPIAPWRRWLGGRIAEGLAHPLGHPALLLLSAVSAQSKVSSQSESTRESRQGVR